jgi:hypothetical protein
MINWRFIRIAWLTDEQFKILVIKRRWISLHKGIYPLTVAGTLSGEMI